MAAAPSPWSTSTPWTTPSRRSPAPPTGRPCSTYASPRARPRPSPVSRRCQPVRGPSSASSTPTCAASSTSRASPAASSPSTRASSSRSWSAGTRRGADIRLVMRRADVRTLPHGPRTSMWTYDGSYPGPTIRRRGGRGTEVTVVNRLPRGAGSMSTHLHGDHHASADDGQPTTHLIARGGERTYDYPLVVDGRPEPGSFFWYHDHRMDRTARNNWRGLQGMFIVTDPPRRDLRLPTGRPRRAADGLRAFLHQRQPADRPVRRRPGDGGPPRRDVVDGCQRAAGRRDGRRQGPGQRPLRAVPRRVGDPLPPAAAELLARSRATTSRCPTAGRSCRSAPAAACSPRPSCGPACCSGRPSAPT